MAQQNQSAFDIHHKGGRYSHAASTVATRGPNTSTSTTHFGGDHTYVTHVVERKDGKPVRSMWGVTIHGTGYGKAYRA